MDYSGSITAKLLCHGTANLTGIHCAAELSTGSLSHPLTHTDPSAFVPVHNEIVMGLSPKVFEPETYSIRFVVPLKSRMANQYIARNS